MDSSHPWVANVGKSNMHPAMHGCLAITDDPNKYHVTGFGTVLPHLPPGMSGGNAKAAGAMESATGDGVSPGFRIEAPSIVFIDPEDPVTGEGARGVINQSKISARNIEVVMADSAKLEEKMVKLAQISQEDVGHYGEPGPIGSQDIASPSASIPQFQFAGPSRDYAFEQALRAPALPSTDGRGMPLMQAAPSQPGIPSALYSVLEQQTEMIKMLQERAGLTEKKRSDFEPHQLNGDKDKVPEKASGDYSHIGLPWLKDPPEAPKVTAIFSFGRMTYKTRFSDVSIRKSGTNTCVFLALDERWEGNAAFPDPSDEPFRLVVPEKEIDLMVYDAGLRLDCLGKITFVILLAAEDQMGV